MYVQHLDLLYCRAHVPTLSHHPQHAVLGHQMSACEHHLSHKFNTTSQVNKQTSATRDKGGIDLAGQNDEAL
jgi:hypothetical protein